MRYTKLCRRDAELHFKALPGTILGPQSRKSTKVGYACMKKTWTTSEG